MTRRTVLFLAEAVSLAHVARLTVLASALDTARFDVHFASSGAFSFCHESAPPPADPAVPRGDPRRAAQADAHRTADWTFHRIGSLAPAEFLARLATFRPVYRRDELERYVADDLALLECIRPDLVITDFRLSAPLAARVAGVPLWSLCNAHWSPFAVHSVGMAPDVLALRWLPAGVVDAVFRCIWPCASRLHLSAINAVRSRYGIVAHRSLSAYYCDGDRVLYADVPELVPLHDVPATHGFIGPVVWSPRLGVPQWWDMARAETRPLAYVTLGSTGRVDLLPAVIQAGVAAGLACMVATAGRAAALDVDPGAGLYTAPFLPGSEAAAASQVVVCNGGSATAHQALAQGRPILGICSNLDQVLTMHAIERAGAGVLLRASEATPARIRRALQALVGASQYETAARHVQAAFERRGDAPANLRGLLEAEFGLAGR